VLGSLQDSCILNIKRSIDANIDKLKNADNRNRFDKHCCNKSFLLKNETNVCIIKKTIYLRHFLALQIA